MDLAASLSSPIRFLSRQTRARIPPSERNIFESDREPRLVLLLSRRDIRLRHRKAGGSDRAPQLQSLL
jgi:hypothetical protein